MKYKEDQFVNTVKVHEGTQPNMNSIPQVSSQDFRRIKSTQWNE